MTTIERDMGLFLENKYDVLETFKKWKAMFEIETYLELKCWTFNNSGEYIDGGFKEYYAIHDIRIEKTILETP